MTQQQHLTPAEVRARYSDKISLQTLANWRTKGSGPKFLRLGGRILYPLSEIEAWERQNMSRGEQCPAS
jgi:hypothetical protein